ncbi:MAG: tRNA-splicing ligase RtcB [Myxococcota bacterium]|jgi:tRNA-splicing ligase RtcB
MSKNKHIQPSHTLIEGEGAPIKAWTDGVPVEQGALKQLHNTASLPFIYRWLAVMPDVHWGIGATVGSVVATEHAIVPAAVGVDIGCGMMAVQTSLTATDLPESLRHVRSAIEAAVPHGRTDNGRKKDRGAWKRVPASTNEAWSTLKGRFDGICDRHPAIAQSNNVRHLGTLGSGNHFIEVCLDENDRVWVMLHSGSRGVGGRIGGYFIRLAREEMRSWYIDLPDKDLAYLPEGSRYFDDYIEAVSWAQDYARANRELMMAATLEALRGCWGIPPFSADTMVVNCHHNYVSREEHFGDSVWVTRKGALRARAGELGIIPGSMGTRSYIVRGKGNPDSFHSCSHGAGRAMSRKEARRRFSLADHERATKGIECRKDVEVIDETPMAYKPIDAVMAAQQDLVEVQHTLRQVVCVKG